MCPTFLDDLVFRTAWSKCHLCQTMNIAIFLPQRKIQSTLILKSYFLFSKYRRQDFNSIQQRTLWPNMNNMIRIQSFRFRSHEQCLSRAVFGQVLQSTIYCLRLGLSKFSACGHLMSTLDQSVFNKILSNIPP